MESAQKTSQKTGRKSSGKGSGDKIKSAYVQYLLTEGRAPASVYKFCVDLGIKEDEFYNHFGSFEGVEQQVWKDFIDRPIALLQADESFGGFSTRERVLAFYFALMEELRGNRSFALLFIGQRLRPELTPGYLKLFRHSFETFFESLLATGKSAGEIANRPFLDKRYPQLFWLHFGFILHFWKDDTSAGFEQTDAAIEKSVNLAFDLIGKGAVDTALDFGKFLYQQQR